MSEELTTNDFQAITKSRERRTPVSPSFVEYLVVPTLYLIVAFLGGMRIAAEDGAFLFLPPPLVALVLGSLALLMFVRSGMVSIGGWIGRDKAVLSNLSGVAVLACFFVATIQLFNSLLPERGITFWIVGFCFVWTLWNNLFAELPASKLLKSTLALFGLAFAAKYLLLASMAGEPTGSWWQRWFEAPGREAATWLLDLPRYAAATGYIQFFVLAAYAIALYLTPRTLEPKLLDTERESIPVASDS